MKSIKKLIMASLMLVLAFVGVVASTFAWFTMQNQVDVDNIQLNVSEAGDDLQISTDGSAFSYNVGLTTPEGELIPVTFLQSDKSFQTLDLNENVYEYVAASAIAGAGTQGYLTFNLWFRSAEALDVKFNATAFEDALTSNAVEPEDLEAIKTLRIMFVQLDELDAEVSRTIYEPFYIDGSSTYGTGNFFDASKTYVSDSFSSFLDAPETGDNTSETHYALKTAQVTANQYTANNLTSGVAVPTNTEVLPLALQDDMFLNVATTVANNAAGTKVAVYIWIEGWDGNTTNDAAMSSITAYLMFIGEKNA